MIVNVNDLEKNIFSILFVVFLWAKNNYKRKNLSDFYIMELIFFLQLIKKKSWKI